MIISFVFFKQYASETANIAGIQLQSSAASSITFKKRSSSYLDKYVYPIAPIPLAQYSKDAVLASKCVNGFLPLIAKRDIMVPYTINPNNNITS